MIGTMLGGAAALIAAVVPQWPSTRLDVLQPQRLAQQRVVQQVDLPTDR
jgi:hypothetical protein